MKASHGVSGTGGTVFSPVVRLLGGGLRGPHAGYKFVLCKRWEFAPRFWWCVPQAWRSHNNCLHPKAKTEFSKSGSHWLLVTWQAVLGHVLGCSEVDISLSHLAGQTRPPTPAPL